MQENSNDLTTESSSDPDASFATQANSQARGVVIDLTLAAMDIGFELESRPSSLLHELTSKELDYHNLRMLAAFLPLIIELKRAPMRSASLLKDFIISLNLRLVSAKEQCRYQAHCIFSNPRYQNQNQSSQLND